MRRQLPLFPISRSTHHLARQRRTCTVSGMSPASRRCRSSSESPGSRRGIRRTCRGGTSSQDCCITYLAARNSNSSNCCGAHPARQSTPLQRCSPAVHFLSPGPDLVKNSSHQSNGLGVTHCAPQGAAAGAPRRRPSRSATSSSCGHSSCNTGRVDRWITVAGEQTHLVLSACLRPQLTAASCGVSDACS